MQAGVRMAHVLNLIADGWRPESAVTTRTYSAAVLVVLFVVIMVLAIALATVLCLVRRRGVTLGSLFGKADSSTSDAYGATDSLRTSLL